MAQFEREMMLERQREGIAKAKAAGKYKGREPTARRRLMWFAYSVRASESHTLRRNLGSDAAVYTGPYEPEQAVVHE